MSDHILKPLGESLFDMMVNTISSSHKIRHKEGHLTTFIRQSRATAEVTAFLPFLGWKEVRTASRLPLISSIRPAKNKKMDPWREAKQIMFGNMTLQITQPFKENKDCHSSKPSDIF